MRRAPVTERHIEEYLEVTRDFPVTPGTFLQGKLQGKAKRYSRHYLRRMEDRLQRMEGVQQVESVRKRVAYVQVV